MIWVLRDIEGDAPDLIIANPPYMLDAQGRTYRAGGGAFGEGLSCVSCAKRSIGSRRVAPSSSTRGRHKWTEWSLLQGVSPLLESKGLAFDYEEIDPDVFGEEISEPGYERVERIAAVGLRVRCGERAASVARR